MDFKDIDMDIPNIDGLDGMEHLDSFGSIPETDTKEPVKAAAESPVMTDTITSSSADINKKFHNYNCQTGRMIALITKNEPAIKIGKKKVPRKDAEGRYVKDPSKNLVEKDQEAFEKDGKVPAYARVTDEVVSFKQAKPSPIMGCVMSIPVETSSKSDIIDSILGGVKIDFDSSKKDTVVKFFPKEQMYPTIVALFGNRIKEDERVMGADAGIISVSNRRTASRKDANTTGEETNPRVRTSLVLESKTKYRTQLITDKNYIPLQTYEKLSQQNLDAEGAASLNTAIESAIKDKTTYDRLSDETKQMIHWNPDDTDHPVTSEYFKVGKPGAEISVKSFFSDEEISDVRIPVKVRKPKKDTGYTYSYVTYSISDEENGPLADPRVRELITKYIGMSIEEFKKEVSTITVKKKPKKLKSNELTTDEYLRSFSGASNAYEYATPLVSPESLSEFLMGIA